MYTTIGILGYPFKKRPATNFSFSSPFAPPPAAKQRSREAAKLSSPPPCPLDREGEGGGGAEGKNQLRRPRKNLNKIIIKLP